jgi:predicted hotdog family 3-hydroxylacyl-ACP dehydratase
MIPTDDTLPPIEELVPHRPPMLLIDRVCAHGDDVTISTVAIRPDSPFVAAGSDGRLGVPAVVGIEYMAQTVAAYAGLSARKEKRAPRIGFLLGCRELSLATDAFAVGEILTVEVRRVFGENDLGSFSCKVVGADGRTLASGSLTVYQGPLPEDMTI